MAMTAKSDLFAESLKNALVKGLWFVFGRHNVVRLGRMLNMRSRLDSRNLPEINGERRIQRSAIATAAQKTSVTVFDIGANIGDWTLSFLHGAESFGLKRLTVHAFEPSADTCRALSKRLSEEGAKGVILVNKALSDHVGRATLHVAGKCAGTNTLEPGEGVFPAEETVELTTIDAYSQEAGIEFIDFVKIDAEGHDMAVLQGARDMLLSRAIAVLQFEYNRCWIHSRHYLRDAFELLNPCGYHIGKITPEGVEFYSGWHYELETYYEGNYIACPQALMARFPQVRWWNA